MALNRAEISTRASGIFYFSDAPNKSQQDHPRHNKSDDHQHDRAAAFSFADQVRRLFARRFNNRRGLACHQRLHENEHRHTKKMGALGANQVKTVGWFTHKDEG